ncbi:MAG: alpha/beta hydrolase [Alphaproteobacteria bacterium]|nr:alpha/beta hydrolase [Alphaproteobacteria bacterium]
MAARPPASHPNVVMIHGAFCGGWAFEHFAHAFAAAGHAVQTPDLRYHDCGTRPPAALGTTSMADYAEDLEALIAGFERPPVLVGHSMGGLLAQMLATRCEIAALVLLSPSAPWGVLPSTMFEVASAGAMFLTGSFWCKPIAPNYDIAASNALNLLPPEERRRVFERFVPESGLATFEIMNWALDTRRATFVGADDVRCPVLCFSGTEDYVNPPPTVRRVAGRYRERATYHELNGHSHWMIGEPGWEGVAARALAWLDETLAQGYGPAQAAAD